MNTQHADNMRLAEEAADWVVRRLKDRSPECNVEFLRWLKLSPHNIDEFLLSATTYASLRGSEEGLAIADLVPEGATNVVELKKGFFTPAPFRSSPEYKRPLTVKASRRIALAASAAVFAIGGWMLWAYVAHTYSTGVGEQRMVRLEDGSLMHLNTRSRVRVSFSGGARQLRLLNGEAFFSVAKDPARPFQVLTDDAQVQVIGTQFNVYEHGDETRVAVLDGQVRVAALTSGSAPAKLSTGEQADVRKNGEVARRTHPDVSTALSWRDRQLIFRAVPLAVVAEQFNRYNDYQIRIEGEKLAQRLIWGVFPVDEPQALVKFLAQDKSVKLSKTRSGLTATPTRTAR